MHNSAVRVVIITGHRFGVEALNGIMNSPEARSKSVEIVHILALHPRHAVSTVGYVDATWHAKHHRLPVSTFVSAKSSQVYDLLADIPHDYLVVIGLSQLIPDATLQLPALHNKSTVRNSMSHGCIGMHPTLLPIGRGRAPIPWTILHRLPRSGVTTFWLEAEADSGGIIDAEYFDVLESYSAGDLFEVAAKAHFALGSRLVSHMAVRKVIGVPQDLAAGSCWSQRKPADGWLDFSASTSELLQLIRASSSPYPGAFFVYKDSIIMVLAALASTNNSNAPPGTIVKIDDSGLPSIAAGDGVISITQLSSARPVSFSLNDKLTTSQERAVDHV